MAVSQCAIMRRGIKRTALLALCLPALLALVAGEDTTGKALEAAPGYVFGSNVEGEKERPGELSTARPTCTDAHATAATSIPAQPYHPHITGQSHPPAWALPP